MEGKTCVVTGASDGIGKETAKGLAALGARVVMVSRTPEKAEAAAAEILDAGAVAPVEIVLADLAQQKQVRAAAEEILERFPRVDVLVNNAGVYRLRRQTTPDGYEETFAVNHLAPFLLTNLLLDRLRASAPARVVTVASTAHYGGRIDFEDLMLERRFGSWRAYCRSKLANVMFTYALARRVLETGVTANCLHPGAVSTNLGSGNRLPNRVIMTLLRPFFPHNAASGAKPSIHLASSPEVAEVNGRYFDRMKEKISSGASLDEEAQERLWRVSQELTGLA